MRAKVRSFIHFIPTENKPAGTGRPATGFSPSGERETRPLPLVRSRRRGKKGRACLFAHISMNVSCNIPSAYVTKLYDNGAVGRDAGLIARLWINYTLLLTAHRRNFSSIDRAPLSKAKGEEDEVEKRARNEATTKVSTSDCSAKFVRRLPFDERRRGRNSVKFLAVPWPAST